MTINHHPIPEQTGMRKPALSSSTGGFTLIEILFAMTILAVGILGMSKMQIAAINGNATSQRLTESTIAAQGRMDQLMTIPFDQVDYGSDDSVPGLYIEWYAMDSIYLNEGASSPDMKKVAVTVYDSSWNIVAEYDFIKLKH